MRFVKIVTSLLMLGSASVMVPVSAQALVAVPDSDTLYLSDYLQGTATSDLFSVAPSSVDLTAGLIGTQNSLSSIEAGDYDSSSGASYQLGLDEDGDCSLAELDLSSGANFSSVKISEDASSFYDSCNALTTTTSGDTWVTYQTVGEANQYIGLVDPSTGDITFGQALVGDLIPGSQIEWIAANPTTDDVFAGTADGDVFLIDISDGSMILIDNILPNQGSTYSADFDTWGRLWFSVTPISGETEVWTATPDDDFATPEVMGVISHEGIVSIDFRALFFVTEPNLESDSFTEDGVSELAQTGVQTWVPAGAAALLSVGGFNLLLASRKTPTVRGNYKRGRN